MLWGYCIKFKKKLSSLKFFLVDVNCHHLETNYKNSNYNV